MNRFRMRTAAILKIGMMACIMGGHVSGGIAWAEHKIAFVNLAEVFDGYEKTKQFDQALAEEGKVKQRERDALVLDVRRLKDELTLLSDKGKDEQQQMIDEKIRALQEFDAVARRELGTKRDGIVDEIFANIEAVITDIGKRKGYDFVLNDRVVLYHLEKYDATAEVLRELNDKYKKDKK